MSKTCMRAVNYISDDDLEADSDIAESEESSQGNEKAVDFVEEHKQIVEYPEYGIVFLILITSDAGIRLPKHVLKTKKNSSGYS